MTSFDLNYLFQSPISYTATLEVRTSMYEHWWETIQSLMIYLHNIITKNKSLILGCIITKRATQNPGIFLVRNCWQILVLKITHTKNKLNNNSNKDPLLCLKCLTNYFHFQFFKANAVTYMSLFGNSYK